MQASIDLQKVLTISHEAMFTENLIQTQHNEKELKSTC